MIVKFVLAGLLGVGVTYTGEPTPVQFTLYSLFVPVLLSGCSADDQYVHEETQSSLKKKRASLFTFCSKDVLCPCKLSFAKALNGNNRKKGSKITSQIVLFGVKDSQGLSYV